MVALDARAPRLDFELFTSETSAARREAFLDMLDEVMGEYHPEQPRDRARIEAFVASSLSGRTSSRFLAGFEPSGVAAGVILYTLCTGLGGDWIWLHEIFVRASLRRRGAGEALTAELFRRARADGVRCITGATDPGHEALLKMADRFGMTREPMIWLEAHLA